jgi:hypothetical protein
MMGYSEGRIKYSRILDEYISIHVVFQVQALSIWYNQAIQCNILFKRRPAIRGGELL